MRTCCSGLVHVDVLHVCTCASGPSVTSKVGVLPRSLLLETTGNREAPFISEQWALLVKVFGSFLHPRPQPVAQNAEESGPSATTPTSLSFSAGAPLSGKYLICLCTGIQLLHTTMLYLKASLLLPTHKGVDIYLLVYGHCHRGTSACLMARLSAARYATLLIVALTPRAVRSVASYSAEGTITTIAEQSLSLSQS